MKNTKVILFSIVMLCGSCMVETDRPSGKELLEGWDSESAQFDSTHLPDAVQDNVKIEKDSMETILPQDNAL